MDVPILTVKITKHKIIAIMVLSLFAALFSDIYFSEVNIGGKIVAAVFQLFFLTFIFIIAFSKVELYQDRFVFVTPVRKKTIYLNDIYGIEFAEIHRGRSTVTSFVFLKQDGEYLYHIPLNILGKDAMYFMANIMQLKNGVMIGENLVNILDDIERSAN